MPSAPSQPVDQLQAWETAFADLVREQGPVQGRRIVEALSARARALGITPAAVLNTPYINTIALEEQPPYPGDLDLERRILNIMRWNAMAMVMHANKLYEGIGGHISTYASVAALFEVGFHHFFRAAADDHSGDQVFFQGHASPGIYARAFLEGRLTQEQLHAFRRELAVGGGLSSYPHPWLMPAFWQFPTVSMGLAPITSIYQARFNQYLRARGLLNHDGGRVWAFLGDGEMDEPESLGSITLASRECLDNLVWVVNCNLQRLDGPVRGNGKIIQELEAIFRGGGWNVIKVIWGDDWDPLLARDSSMLLRRRMEEVNDGQYQKYSTESGAYIRQHFFAAYPELLELVKDLNDTKLQKLRRGGHDLQKIYAAYAAARDHKGAPTVILAKTIKGYGLGEAGEGRNVTHQQKKLNEKELRSFRDRLGIPIRAADLADTPFYHPGDDSEEVVYLRERRQVLGGYLPQRRGRSRSSVPAARPDLFTEYQGGSGKREMATTMVMVRLLRQLMSEPELGRRIVPIVPDEARTFGMDALFRKFGIYSSKGQQYEPVDSDIVAYYREATDGQLLEEGITEAGSMASFIAAATAYATHSIAMIPFFFFYSMFGFQRIGDLIWQNGDARGRGFLIGATAGRTTLAGEGLQHQDGHSHVLASTVPTVRAYDPAFAYEIGVIVQEGLRRMSDEGEDCTYYLTVSNELYSHPPMPEGAREGILQGLYLLAPSARAGGPSVNLLASGAIGNEALRAQGLLEARGIAAHVWSVTSYSELRREALAVRRWNMLHPQAPARLSYLARALAAHPHPIIAASDYMKIVAEQISPFVPAGLFALGTDGFGRSDLRPALRRFFEVDAESITVAALHVLSNRGEIAPALVSQAITDLGIDPEKIDPATA